MGSGKRASMREGPLAALFRSTADEGVEEELVQESQPEPRREVPHPSLAREAAEPERAALGWAGRRGAAAAARAAARAEAVVAIAGAKARPGAGTRCRAADVSGPAGLLAEEP